MDPKVKKFLDSLRSKGLNDSQIQHLATFQKSPKAWKAEAKRNVQSNANRAAASMGPVKGQVQPPRPVNGGRGRQNYRSTAGQSKFAGEAVGKALGDMFSKNNPKSAPNAAAHGADKIVNTATGFAKNLGKRDQNSRNELSREALRRAAARRAAFKNRKG